MLFRADLKSPLNPHKFSTLEDHRTQAEQEKAVMQQGFTDIETPKMLIETLQDTIELATDI